MIRSSLLSGGVITQQEVDRGETIEKMLRKYGVSAIFKDYIFSYQSTMYCFDLADAKDITKIEKAIKYLRVDLKKRVELDTTLEKYAFSIYIFYKENTEKDLLCALLKDIAFQQSGAFISCLGVDIYAKQVLLDFKRISHVLIAGATGSGKSVLLHTLICSMLYNTHIVDMRYYFVDCKQVESIKYVDLPNMKIINDVDSALNMLRGAIDLMETRYLDMAQRGIREWDDAKIFIIIDELADLMLSSRYEAEPLLVKLAQKSRACGIHLILATQRPSVNVITGLIKANISTRIALQTASNRDSICILDHKGAEQLHGCGDAIIKLPYTTNETRFQVAYTSDRDIDITVKQVKEDYEENYVKEAKKKKSIFKRFIDFFR